MSAWFALSSSSNIVDSRNQNKKSHGSFDRGSKRESLPDDIDADEAVARLAQKYQVSV